jgi:DNA invertase Pin-like site-specific DNA recombinase
VAEREQLATAIDYLRDGDVLVATKLDRIARSMRHLVEIVDRLDEKGAELRILGMQLQRRRRNNRTRSQHCALQCCASNRSQSFI